MYDQCLLSDAPTPFLLTEIRLQSLLFSYANVSFTCLFIVKCEKNKYVCVCVWGGLLMCIIGHNKIFPISAI